MLLTFASSLRFSASICASLFGCLVVVGCPFPDIRVPFWRRLPPLAGASLERARAGSRPFPGFATSLPEEFVVEVLLEEFPVPTVLLTGASGDLAAFPTPLGSFSELLSPPTLADPFGTPLMLEVPAPAEPALGDPAGLAAPLVGPLAAPAADPPADAPPADAPPEELPPPPPPPPPP